jgi:hypothetical protein
MCSQIANRHVINQAHQTTRIQQQTDEPAGAACGLSLHPEFPSSGGRLPVPEERRARTKSTRKSATTAQTGAMQSRQNAYPPSSDSRPKPSKTAAEMPPAARPLSPQPTTSEYSRRHGAAEAREGCRKRHSPPSSRGTRSRGGDYEAGGERDGWCGWKRAEHVARARRWVGTGKSARPPGVCGDLRRVGERRKKDDFAGRVIFPSLRLRGAWVSNVTYRPAGWR